MKLIGINYSSMKVVFIKIFLVCFVITFLIYTFSNRDTYEYTNHADVILTNEGFQPTSVYLKQGGTITFSTKTGEPFWPASNSHPTHFIYPEFDPRNPIAPSDTWTFKFDKLGKWGYHDHIRSYFTGTVYVGK